MNAFSTDPKLVVKDGEGKVIGQVTKADPEPVVTPHDRIAEGLRKQAAEARSTLTKLADTLSGYARNARTEIDRTSQWEFSKRLASRAKVAELKGKFDAATKGAEYTKIRSHLLGPEDRDFLFAFDAHLSHMRKHFEDNTLGDLRRF